MKTVKAKMKTGGIKKSSTISTKPKMKMGGAKKPLRKAQTGRSTGPTYSTDAVPASKDKNIYAGPLTERDSKALDNAYPSTAGRNAVADQRGMYSPKAVEQYNRRNDENFLRSRDPEVQQWNANQSYPGEEYPVTRYNNFKKGGATRKMQKGGSMTKMKTGGMVNSNKKVSATKVATGKVGGVSKAISKVAVKSASPKGRVGGTSKAPRTATPKAKMGGMMKGKKC